MEFNKFKESSTVCELDIHRLESDKSSPGKMLISKEKLLGQRFKSKHIVQIQTNVAVTAKRGAKYLLTTVHQLRGSK